MRGRAQHWNGRYATVGARHVSWFAAEPTGSLAMIDVLEIEASHSVIDIGGGASTLANHLIARGVSDLAVLDVSEVALSEARHRLADSGVEWLCEDVLAWSPHRRWDVWHDRAVFHFLTAPEDRVRYRELVDQVVEPGGFVVIGTFAEDGPESCSGLPVVRYSPEALAEELGVDRRNVTSRRELHTTPAGTTQSFTWIGYRK